MIHHIGRVTGKRTISEFVKSEPIAQALQAIGIDYAQGYAIARPRPFEGITPHRRGSTRWPRGYGRQGREQRRCRFAAPAYAHTHARQIRL